MSSGRPRPLERLLLALALLAHPEPERRRYRDEIAADLADLTRERARSAGRLAAARLTARILVDVAASGLASRSGRGSAKAPGGGSSRRRSEMNGVLRTCDSLRGDLRDAWRSLRRTPGITLAAILLLALGVGANAAVWSALRATWFAEIEAPEPARLVVPRLTLQADGAAEPERFPWSYPKYRVLREAEGPFEAVAGYATRTVTVRGAGEAFRAEMQIADPAYFELLGARPAAGALYTETSVASAPLVAVLSHRLWSARLGGDPGLVGERIVINGRPLTVLGVLPAGFRGLGGEDGLWVPFEAVPSLLNPRQLQWAQAHWLNVLGRLRGDVEWEQARERVRAIGRMVDETHPDEGSSAVMGADLERLSEVRRNAAAERAVRLLAGAAGAVLLIACANLAILFLGRGARRMRDASIRRALGAGRWPVIRGALIEAWLLASLGAVAGLAVAAAGARWIAAAWPEQFSMGEARVRYADLELLGVDAATFAVTLGLAWGAGLSFGIVPAWRAARSAGNGGLRAGANVPPRARGFGLGGRDLLVAAQVALTLVLLAATGLLAQSLLRLARVSTGVQAPGQVLSARYELPRPPGGPDDPAAFHRRFVERLGSLPGVRSVTMASASPFAGHSWVTAVRKIDGRAEFSEAERPSIGIASVDDGYFETLGVPLVAGRGFDSRDRAGGPPVAVLGRRAARELYGEEAPIGRRLAMGIGLTPSGTDVTAEVVGVVEDVLYQRPDQGLFPDAYVSVRQEPFGDAVLLVRTEGPPERLAEPVRRSLAELDPRVPLYGVTTLAELRQQGMGDTRVLGTLVGLFAGLGVLLAAVGTYGTISCWVDVRRRDLGLRLALGARGGQLVRLVLGRGLRTLAFGAGVGCVGAILAARLLEGVLYEIQPRDPVTLALATTLLIAVGLGACWRPALLAARTDPNAMLRTE